LLGGELLERALALPPWEQWRLVEALDPQISHFEFFLTADAAEQVDFADDRRLLSYCLERNRCLWGWPSDSLLGPDLMPLNLEPGDLPLAEALERAPGLPLGQLELAMEATERCLRARRLMAQRVLLPVAA
jgi:hypothetical protein